MKKTLIYTLILLPFFFNGCVKNDVVQPVPETSKGAVIVNEGLFGQNNSTITYFDFQTGNVSQEVYSAANNGGNLGDTGNDMEIFGGKGYIVVSVSQKVEVINMKDFTSAGMVDFSNYGQPREIAIASENKAFVTTYDDIVVEFDPTTLSVVDTFAAGSKPEGIVYAAGKIFVANSGWGTGETVSIIDISNGNDVSEVKTGVNPRVLLTDDNYVYAVCSDNFYAPTGREGVYKIDAKNSTLVDSLIIDGGPGDAAISGDGPMFVINGNGVVLVDLTTFAVANENFISAGAVNSLGFGIYSIGYDSQNETLYLGNPKDYTQNGEVVAFDLSGAETNRFAAGINPGTIIFYVSQ